MWSKHKTWVYKSTKHSVMLVFSSETFQQNVLQESLGTIERSCTKDYQKSHRTKISVHRATECLTEINNKKGGSHSELCQFHFAMKAPRKNEHEQELLRYQQKVRNWMHALWSCTVNKRTLTSQSTWSSTKRPNTLLQRQCADMLFVCKVSVYCMNVSIHASDMQIAMTANHFFSRRKDFTLNLCRTLKLVPRKKN